MPDPVLTLLPDSLQAAWRDYFARPEAEGALVEGLLALSDTDRAAWVKALGVQLWNGGDQHPLRDDLFLRVVLPALADGYHRREAPYARWLAQCFRHVYRLREQCLLILGIDEYDTRSLLREALERDPSDGIAKEYLFHNYAFQFNLYIQPAPERVDADPQVFHVELREFMALAQQHDLLPEYAGALPEWQFYCVTWLDYHERKHEFVSYPEYLTTLPIPPTP